MVDNVLAHVEEFETEIFSFLENLNLPTFALGVSNVNYWATHRDKSCSVYEGESNINRTCAFADPDMVGE